MSPRVGLSTSLEDMLQSSTLYVIAMVVVYGLKWRAHASNSTQWPMFDYCYSINALTAVWVTGCFELSPSMRVAAIVSSLGPVLFATQLYSISLSFDDAAHMANWFFHVPPAVACYMMSSGADPLEGFTFLQSLMSGILWYWI